MTEPRKALEEAGARTDMVAADKGEVQGMDHDEKGSRFPADVARGSMSAGRHDARLLPGGVANLDRAVVVTAAWLPAGNRMIFPPLIKR